MEAAVAFEELQMRRRVPILSVFLCLEDYSHRQSLM